MDERIKKRITAVILLMLFIAVVSVTAYTVCAPVLRMADDPNQLRTYIGNMGIWGYGFFVLVIAVQVVAAFIPAGPIEIAAGYCFGALQGAVICDIGMTIGSLIVFLLVRRFGMAFIEIFISRKKIESLKFLKTNGQSRVVIFLLFLIPGAPKDVLAYAVGLTDLGLVSWLFITAVGRFPSIILTTMSGDALGDQRYDQFITVMIVIAAVAGAGSVLYRIWSRRRGFPED